MDFEDSNIANRPEQNLQTPQFNRMNENDENIQQKEFNQQKEPQNKKQASEDTLNQQQNENKNLNDINSKKILDNKQNLFFNMLTGFLSFLSIRKQGYVGKPQTAMFFDEKKKRWVIEGEDESDDDEPPPPPPGARKNQTQVQESSIKKEQLPTQQTGVNALTTVAFAGALANRNRAPKIVAKGKDASQVSKNAFNTTPIGLQEENKKQEQIQENKIQEQQSLFQTAIGEQIEKSEQILEEICDKEESAKIFEIKEQDLQKSIILNQEEEQNRNNDDREQLWLEKYNKQFEKIKDLREKVRRYERELLIQRQENEQTIENFTQLCQDLKFRGMDEVDDLQAQIRGLQNQVEILASQKAELQFQNEQYSYENQDFKYQNDLLNGKIDQLRELLAQSETYKSDTYEKLEQIEIDKNELIQILDLQCENEKFKWQIQEQNQNTLRQSLQINQLKSKLNQLNDQQQTSLKTVQSLKMLLESENKVHAENIEQINRQFNDSQSVLKLQIEKINKEKEERKNQLIETQSQISVFQEQIQQLHQVNLLLQQQIQQKNEKEKYYEIIKQKMINYEQFKKNVEDEGQNQIDTDFDEDFSKSSFSKENESIEDKENSCESDYQQLRENDYQKSSIEEKNNQMNKQLIDNKSILIQQSQNDEQVISPDKQSILASQIQKQIDSKINQDSSVNQNQFNTADNFSRSQQIKDKIDVQIRNQMKKIQKQKILNRKLDPQILKEQLEEYKKQIKNDFEQRLVIEKKLHQKESFLSIQKEGIQDISNVIQSIMASENIMLLQRNKQEIKNAQASTLFENNENKNGYNFRDKMGDQQSSIVEKELEQLINPYYLQDTHIDNQSSDSSNQVKMDHEIDLLIKQDQWDLSIEKIINKIFEIQKYYKSQISELQHKYQMMQMKSDQVDSLTLDIEIMTQEKQLSEQEINQLKQQVGQANLQTKLMQQRLSEQMEKQSSEQAKMVVCEGEIERLKRLQQREQYKHEDAIQSIKSTQQRQIKEIKDQYEQDIIPSVLAKQKEQLSSNQQTLTDKINSQRNTINDLNLKVQQLESQHQILKQEIREVNLEKEKMSEAAQINEIEKQELQNKVNYKQEEQKSELKNNNKIIEKMGEEMKHQKQTFYQQVSEIRKENDLRCSEMIEKRDLYKAQTKELKKQVDQQLIYIQELTNEVKLQKEQANLQEDKQFWQLIQQVNSLKQKNQIDQTQYQQEIQQINQIIENRQDELKEREDEIVQIQIKQKEYQDQITLLSQEILIKEQLISEKEIQMNKEAQLNQNNEIFEKELIQVTQNLRLKQEENEEVKNLYEYQMSINDKLNFKISELKNRINEQEKNIIEERQSHELKIQIIQDQLSVLKNIQNDNEKELVENEQNTESISVMKWSDESNDYNNKNILNSDIVQSFILNQDTKEEPVDIKKCLEIQIQTDEQENIIELTREIQNLKQQILELEYKNQLIIAESDKENLDLTEKLNNEISNLKAELKILTEMQNNVPLEDNKNTESLQNDIEELKQKNQKFKNAAEEMASKFKEKIKKEKEQNKKHQEAILGLQSKIQDDKNDFDLQINDINKCLSDLLTCLQNNSIVELNDLIQQSQEDNQINQTYYSKVKLIVSKIIENWEQSQLVNNKVFIEIKKIMMLSGVENEKYDQLIEQNNVSLNQDIILELQNIFQQIIDKQQALLQQNQQLNNNQEILNNQNELIRNEQEEQNQKLIKAQQEIGELQQDKIEYLSKISLKQEYQQEEIKIEQKDEQKEKSNSELEQKLTFDEQKEIIETRIQISPTKNQTLRSGELNKVVTKVEPVQKAVAMQQKAGFFGQIVASLFLTESDAQLKQNRSTDVQTDEHKSKKGERQDTEYEEYYEYDEEEDGDAV